MSAQKLAASRRTLSQLSKGFIKKRKRTERPGVVLLNVKPEPKLQEDAASMLSRDEFIAQTTGFIKAKKRFI